MPTMLYYPFAAAPATVIQRAVLYWDGLRTVVAPGWQSRIGSEMTAIKDRGFYTPVEPYNDFRGELRLDEIGHELEHAIAEIGEAEAQLPEQPPSLDSTAMLYVGKLDSSVVDMLVTRGYAARHPGARWRLYGSPRLMHVVVSIIAARIAAENNRRAGSEGADGLHPHTDVTAAFRMNVDPIAGHRVADGWRIDIGPLLPVPGAGVDIGDLWNFRELHESARADMMTALMELLSELESRHPADAYARVERRLNDAREQLLRYGKESGVSLVLRKGALVTVAIAAGYAGQLLDVPGLGVSAAVLGVVSGLAVNVASTSIRQPGRLEHDYRYLHLWESEIKKSGFPV
nr:hypothetical protein [uncultured Actinoplanes sp.]